MNSPSTTSKDTGGPELSALSGPPPLARYFVVELVNGDIFLPGQGCRDPITNKCVGITHGSNGEIESYNIQEQTVGVFKNIEALLLSRGLTREHIVDAMVFMKNMGDFDAVNTILKDYFNDCKKMPTITIIPVADLPGENFIEIKIHASRVTKLDTVSSSSPLAKYEINELVTGKTLEIENSNIRERTADVFRKVEELLLSRGLTREHIVDALVYMKNKDDFDAMNEVWNDYFGSDCKKLPARTTIFPADLSSKSFIEIKVLASRIAKVD